MYFELIKNFRNCEIKQVTCKWAAIVYHYTKKIALHQGIHYLSTSIDNYESTSIGSEDQKVSMLKLNYLITRNIIILPQRIIIHSNNIYKHKEDAFELTRSFAS
jgi:hypothetical protein